MAKKRRGGRSKRRGTRGLGQLKLKGMARDVVPPLVGSTLTMGTIFGIRAYLRPEPGTTSELVYRWAPAIGIGAGVLGSLTMYLLGGSGPAASAALTSVLQGTVIAGMERLNAATPGAFAALMGETPALPVGNGNNTLVEGLRAIVPEYGSTNGLNAIVMEQVQGAHGLGQNMQNQGADIQLRGMVQTDAFGSSPYN